MTRDPASMVRLMAAIEAGDAAAKLRLCGHVPLAVNTLEPSDYGAFQWAVACGFAEDRELRSAFSHAFCDVLDAARGRAPAEIEA